MPVFENLKNFIRHGKQAYQREGSSELIGSPGSGNVDLVSPATTPVPRKEAYNVAAQQMVAEETRLRLNGRLPTYPGLERFHLIDKMGDGAFSVVYKALDSHTNSYVAVKVINKQQLSNSQRSSILKEAAIMRQLDHKNVVELKDFSETPDHYFIVLELIPGGELFHQIVRLTYFSEDLSRHVIKQVAEAVRYLHEVAGVVHRDIKPENLLFYPCDFVPSKVKKVRKGEDETKEDEGEFTPGVGAGGIGVIKLADFGLSKIIWDSKTMTPCGTVGYTAPEIVKDEHYSKSVDMWALGCVLYTILCGFPPFYDESIEILTEKVAKGQYTFLSPWWDEISPAAKDLVSHLLTVDPNSRYTIDQFLQHPWITQDKSTSVSAPSPTGVSRTSVPVVKGNAIHIENKDYVPPVSVTLKEVFDVSNAVYRMEEENSRSRRRPIQQDVLAEEDEEEDEVQHAQYRDAGTEKHLLQPEGNMAAVEEQLEKVSVGNRVPRSSRRGGAGPTNMSSGFAPSGIVGNGGLFELHLEGATLLERRKRTSKPIPAPLVI